MVTVGVMIFDGKGIEAGYIDERPMAPRASPPAGSAVPHLTRLARRVYFIADVERLGISLKQIYILASLRDGGALPQQSLCDLMHTTQNTVVAWLNELEEAGLVERLRDPEDRRKHNVVLTRAGALALDRAERELVRLEDEVLSALTSDERAQLRKLMTKALSSFSA